MDEERTEESLAELLRDLCNSILHKLPPCYMSPEDFLKKEGREYNGLVYYRGKRSANVWMFGDYSFFKKVPDCLLTHEFICACNLTAPPPYDFRPKG
jgi:hypothetical protein